MTVNPGQSTAANMFGKKAQSKEVKDFHNRDDVDSGDNAHHHTIGFGTRQAGRGSELKKALNQITVLQNRLVNPPFIDRVTDNTQSLVSGASTVVLWQTAVDVDGDLPYAAGVFTVGVEGWYLVDGFVSFANDATGTGRRLVQVRRGAVVDLSCNTRATTTGEHAVPFSKVLKCEVGDLIDIRANQNSGGNLNITATSKINIRKFVI